MTEQDIKQALEDIKQLPPEEAIEGLSALMERFPENDEIITFRGQKYWAINRRREAINDYLAAIAINPQSRAKLLLDYANSILNFYNKDLLNP